MLLVHCSRCSHNMKYDPKPGEMSEKKKRCVYCGTTFKVHADLTRSRIVARA